MTELHPALLSPADGDLRLVRALLRARAADAVLQDQIDCAALALELEHREIAVMLYGACCLRMGFSSVVHARLHAINGRARLWDDLGEPPEVKRSDDFSVDQAVAELARLMRFGVPKDVPAIELPSPPAAAPPPFADLADRASRVLRDLPAAAAAGRSAELLRTVRADTRRIAPIPLEEHIGLPLADFAARYALEHLRRFLVANADLLDAEEEMPGLFDATLRLSPAALGPFFSNVRMIIRDVRDLFGLIEVAAGESVPPAGMEYWAFLLSAHLRHHQLLDLIDELGDRGMTLALALILGRMARSDGPHYPADFVWRIRDVCLDIAAYETAADAQQVIVLWRAADINELHILAEIRGALNDAVGVEGALEHAIALRPDNLESHRRMAAWKAGLSPPIIGGYGTSPGRRRLRRARVRAYQAAA